MERHPGDGWPVIPFATADAFETWLDEHHDSAPGLWVKLAKQGRGIATITFDESLGVAMRFGWVDSKTHRVDDDFYVLRYQPRGPRSSWSERNKRLAQRLIDDGLMRPAGLAAVEAAKADGRWNA